jgi:hypothetical protein
VVNDQLKMKRHTEEVQSEQENKKIDAHMPLAKKGLCNQSSKQTARRVDSGANEDIGNVVQVDRRYSITSNKATSSYQIP